MSKKILIIEDEEYISDMYKMKFQKEGYDAITAPDGETGFEMAKKELPDLVLLDLVLPKMNGFEVLEKLRDDEATKGLMVYILSNLGQNGEIKQGFSEGADGYMIKSNMTPSQLMENVEKIFKGERVGVKKLIDLESDNEPVGLTGNDTKEETAGTTVDRRTRGKVLLIEDEESIAGIYKIGFEKNDFEVDIAKNGAWGVKIAGQKKYDAIIMDMVMPAMNGFEAIQRLKTSDNTKEIPIIILSNSAQDRDVQQALELGAAGFLMKSHITPAKLVEEVKKIISKK
jgi:two-component system, cell cycle response regulator